MADPSSPDAPGAARGPDDPAALSELMLVDHPATDADQLDAAPLMTGLPFAGALGIRMIASGAGEATLAIPYDPRLIGDPDTGVIHGGVVTSLLDTCGGVAVLASPTRPLQVATLDLRIDYMRPAQPGRPLFARARCYRETRLVTFVSAVAYQTAQPDAPIATAVGAFMVDGRRGPVAKPAATDASPPDAGARGDAA